MLTTVASTIAPRYQATVRLTGPVAMADEEFGTIKENATRNGIITFAIVLAILYLALRSTRLIAAVFINLMIGLPLTAALGLMMVGSFNLISVYFAVLFVGIGVDFAIQYSVRYRSERHAIPDLATAIRRAGFHVAAPLTLAGFATAAGFLSFLPTDYKGVSELGLIAGFGMLIAFATSVTVLPALKLNNFALTASDVTSAITAQNVQVTAGELGDLPSSNGQQLNATIVGPSYLQTPEAFGNILLRVEPGGARVRLQDVARVELGAESYANSDRYNGKPASAIAVKLASGANQLTTVAAVKATLNRIKPNLPAGVTIEYPYDTTPVVNASIQLCWTRPGFGPRLCSAERH